MTARTAGVAFGCLLLLAAASPAGTQGQHEAGIVVRTGDGQTSSMCVRFGEDEITGAELLRRSGFDTVTEPNALGTAICSIDGEGCSAEDCFCRYPTFWGYWTNDDGSWTFSDAGASDRVVRDGSLDAWSFGPNGEPPPSDVTLSDVCTARAAAATPAGTPLRRPPDYLPLVAIASILALAAIVVTLRRRRGPGRAAG